MTLLVYSLGAWVRLNKISFENLIDRVFTCCRAHFDLMFDFRVVNDFLLSQSNRIDKTEYSQILGSEEFSLKSLSNLAIFARENEEKIYPYIFCADGNSHIVKHLEKTSNIQELYYITIYLDKLQAMITKDLMKMHKAKAKHLLPAIEPKDSIPELLAVQI